MYRKIALISLALIATVACAKKDASAPVAIAAGSAQAGDAKADEKTSEREVIRTGRVELVVAGYDAARAKLDAALAQVKGCGPTARRSHIARAP